MIIKSKYSFMKNLLRLVQFIFANKHKLKILLEISHVNIDQYKFVSL